MKHMRSTTGTWWIIPQGSLQAFRATLRRNVNVVSAALGPVTIDALFVQARGAIPAFDPETARYATSDMVANLAANGSIRIMGDRCSAARLTGETHAWKSFQDLDGALAHTHLGKTMPSKDVIVSSYALYLARLSDVEID